MHLIFTLSQTRESFSNDTLSQHDSKNEHALLRELVQNCLDAARPGKDVAIRISHRDVKSGDLPGLNDLRNALEAAVEFNKNFPKTPKLTAKIREALDQDKLNLLIIQDNGRGLNIDRMNDILHDGASRKDQDSAGSYGNGHFTTFKFSELLYVIYVGVSEENGVLISGHTILASHQSKEGLRGKDGYLAKRITDDIESGFDFFNEGDFNSDFLTTVINDIKSNSGTGSAVIITAFNAATSNFDTEFSEIIKRVCGIHFFPAIKDGKLSLVYEDFDADEITIDKENIDSTLESFSKEAQCRGLRGGPRGDRIFDALQTYSPENRVSIDTTLGPVECYLRSRNVSRYNINLFRKGMWISQRVKGLEERHFSDFEPFDLVMNIDHANNRGLHDLIRACEGSLHMHLEQRTGHEDDWKRLGNYWRGFRDSLKECLTKQSYDEFSPTGFALVDVPENEHSDNRGNTPVKRWVNDTPRKPDNPPPPPPPNPDDANWFKILGDLAEVRGPARRVSHDQLLAIIQPEKEISAPELRVAELLGADSTCERGGDPRLTDFHYCEIKELQINDKNFDFEDNSSGIRKKPAKDGEPTGVYAVRLPKFNAGEKIKILVTYFSHIGDPNSSVCLDMVNRTRELEAENVS